jgi:two-component system, OmpR family, response regulator VanR
MNSDQLAYLIKYTKKLNLLYIEDNEIVKKQTLKMLSSFFENIEVATNGKDAFDIFINNINHFDLIITDIKMPILDGISFIELVRKSNKKIPIVVFSAHDDKEYFLKTINAGIDGYILKPYTITQIASILYNIVSKYNFQENNQLIIYLEDNFQWNTSEKKLYKNNESIKLTKNEIMLFDLFIRTNSIAKSYEEIEDYIFPDFGDNTKRIRNLVTRLKIKLDYELFETMYSYGYTIKYKI